MKLGICYMVYDGFELLEFAARAIRKQIEHISVTYQDISYFGNPADPKLLPYLQKLQSEGLIDELLFYKTDLSIHHKDNELNLRNLGLQASRNAGCTHHISADVDEFYRPDQLEYAKNVMDKGDYDFSVAPLSTYYKHPTFLVIPEQKLHVSFIHPVSNEYNRTIMYPTFPYHMETTRRFTNHSKHILFTRNEFVIHHMSYVRKDIRQKFANSDNSQFYELDDFYKTYDNYECGGLVCLLPEFLNRRTTKVDNYFNIEI